MKYTEEMLRDAVKNSKSVAGVMRYLNTGKSGSVHSHLKKRIRQYSIDTSHFDSLAEGRLSGTRKQSKEILVIIDEGKPRIKRNLLFRAMLESNFIYQCEIQNCPTRTGFWIGKELPLEIDHIDGNWRNCTVTNLRFLCPNCHSQTPSNFRSLSIIAHNVESLLFQQRQRANLRKAHLKNKKT